MSIESFPGGSDSKNLPAMWETWIQSLGWEAPLEKGRQPTPVFLTREFHRQRSLAGYSPWGRKESDMTEQLAHLSMGIGNLKRNLFSHSVMSDSLQSDGL